MPEDLIHTAGPLGDTAAERTVAPLSPPGYELCEEIGHGGMGVVFRARDTALNRDVAVKLLSDRYPPDSPTALRFLSEARITGQLQHPGIPAVHQVGTLGDGRPFLAMKLIKGSTLEAILKQRPDPAADRGRLLAVFEAVCQAVGYAHAQRVIHRDLKPANVMVGAFGEVQVMDWGLAKVLGEERPANAEALATEETRAWTEFHLTPETGSHTQAGSLVGTPAFIPPEQALGEIGKVDERADVFGLGALLVVILTGKPPYVGESFEAVRVQAARGKLEDCFARLEASGAEPGLVVLCKKCLAFEPADRPADAGAVAQAVAGLRAAADERARRAELERVRVEGERATALARSAELRKRRWLALGAAAVVTAGSLVAAYRISLEKTEADRQRAEANKQQVAAEQNAKVADEQRGLAQDAEKQAKANAELAGKQAKLALGTIYDVVTTVDSKLSTKAEMGPLRKELLELVMKRLDEISKDAATSGKADRTMGVALQRMGTFYNQMGQTEREVEVYRRSLAIFERLMRQDPKDDWSRLDAAISYSSLGEIARENEPEPAKAFEPYEKSLALHKDLVLQRNQPEPTAFNRRLGLVACNIKLAMLALVVGDPARARQYADEAVKQSETIVDDPKHPSDYSSHAYFALAQASLHVGDENTARERFQRCQDLRQKVCDAEATNAYARQELARVVQAVGDLEMGLGHPSVARENYAKAHQLFEALAQKDAAPELQWYLANADYSLGTALATQGDKGGALKFYRNCAKTREVLLRDDPKNPRRKIELMMVQARVGRFQDAAKLAAEIRSFAPHHPGMLFSVACCYALCQETDRAADALRQAIEQGYRDTWALQHDPDVEPLRGDPVYNEILKRLVK
jgi:tetratricopeptide (TPR) repeat protein